METNYFIFDKQKREYANKKGFLTEDEAIDFGIITFHQSYDVHLELHTVRQDELGFTSVKVRTF